MSYYHEKGKYQYLWDFYTSQMLNDENAEFNDTLLSPIIKKMLKTISNIYQINQYCSEITWANLLYFLPTDLLNVVAPFDIGSDVQHFFNIEEQAFIESLKVSGDTDDEFSIFYEQYPNYDGNFELNENLINKIADQVILYIKDKYQIVYSNLSRSDIEHYIGDNTFYIDADILENKIYSKKSDYFYDINDVSSSGEINRAFSNKILKYIATGQMKSENPFTRRIWFHNNTLRQIPKKMLKRKSCQGKETINTYQNKKRKNHIQ